ncbi:MAG: DUF445 family protein [Anaerocolumna sp.]
MQWNILIGPVIGALIGLVTNKIAVEMLFHPLNPVYIGKFRLPFTPGIIPKGKARFGKAIGDAVGNNLLNSAAIKDTLLSDDMEQKIEKQLDSVFQKLILDHTTLELSMYNLLGDTTKDRLETKIADVITKEIYHKLSSMNLGQILAAEVIAAVQEKVQGTMLAMFIKPALLAPIEEGIKDRINQYIADNGEEKINSLIQEEYKNLNNQTISSLFSNINTDELKQIILNLYRMFVNKHAEKLLSALNLSKIVEEKVNAMETKEVEELVLSIMKKELGAIVNLGAVIGFVLGLINLFF